MPKQFYTEKDIEDLFQRGVKSLQVTDEVVLTELAYDKARRLGFQLVTDSPDIPPAAPVRPYLSDNRPLPTKRVRSSSGSVRLSLPGWGTRWMQSCWIISFIVLSEAQG